MLRVGAKYGGPILLAIAPLLTSQFSLLDLFGASPDNEGRVMLATFLTGPKLEVEMRIRAALTLAGIGLLLISGYYDAYLPSRTLQNFRYEYLTTIAKRQWRRSGRVRAGLRINVMYLGFRWSMPLGKSFVVVWKDNFQPNEADGGIRLYMWQGVCGKAARKKDAIFIDFRESPPHDDSLVNKWFLQNRFRLFFWQLRRTNHLKAILSVPIFETRGATGQEKHHCVGVINLDAVTDEDANYLNERAQDLAVYLAKHGTLIAKMR